jgi:hypothetical protein
MLPLTSTVALTATTWIGFRQAFRGGRCKSKVQSGIISKKRMDLQPLEFRRRRQGRLELAGARRVRGRNGRAQQTTCQKSQHQAIAIIVITINSLMVAVLSIAFAIKRQLARAFRHAEDGLATLLLNCQQTRAMCTTLRKLRRLMRQT